MMTRKGVVYDAGCVTGVTWRPDYSPALARRELEIIKTGLHCSAVQIRARDTGRLAMAAEAALRQGLEVWFCPQPWNKSPDATLRHVVRAAVAAEELHARWPGQLVFSVGCELTLSMRGHHQRTDIRQAHPCPGAPRGPQVRRPQRAAE
jgi:hypothetical protein